MKKQLPILLMFTIFSFGANAQQCLSSGFCTNYTNQYPSTTFSTKLSTWTTVSAYMNAGNWTLFKVTSGNTYEWSYRKAFGGVSNWNAQLTLSNDSTGQNICFSDIGTTNKAPYISWTATFTGVVRLLTSQSNCASNTGLPYNTLVWRQANGVKSTSELGVDVSHYQGSIAWPQVKAAPKVFAWCKATEGVGYTDPTFTTNMANGISAGVIMGAYDFAHPETNTSSAEAQYFLSVAGPYIKKGSLLPVLDLENPPSGPTLTSAFSSAALTTWVQKWMTVVQHQTGITPVLYTNGFIATYLNSSLNTYPLWIADPDGSATAPPTNIGVWTHWAFKQYSWNGIVSGIKGNVDLDAFNGDMPTFNILIGNTTTGILEKKLDNIFIMYPNPASNNIIIETSLNNDENEIISIYNMQGQLLVRRHIQQQKTEINISGFESGMYFVQLKTEKGVETKKFVKK